MAYRNVPANEEAPKVLLMGMPGAGKTYQLVSLLEAGLEVFVIFTEQGKESLLHACRERGVSTEKLHYARISAGSPGFGTMRKVARMVNMNEQKDLQSMKGIENKNFQQFIELYGLCENFIDQHGNEFGDVSTWENDRVLVIDGLSGINQMSMDLVVGAKPYKTQSDWGCAMDVEMRLITQCVNDLTCGFVLLAHLELNSDQVTGKVYRYPKLLGNKNSYDFGKYFSDVILASDEGDNFTWSTQDKNMQLKSRNLPRSAKLKPGFDAIWYSWSSLFEKGEKVDG